MQRIGDLNDRSMAYANNYASPQQNSPAVGLGEAPYIPGVPSGRASKDNRVSAVDTQQLQYMQQLRLQEEYDLKNALKISARDAVPDVPEAFAAPEPGFRADIGAAGKRAEARA